MYRQGESVNCAKNYLPSTVEWAISAANEMEFTYGLDFLLGSTTIVKLLLVSLPSGKIPFATLTGKITIFYQEY